eukprot:g8098.t1
MAALKVVGQHKGSVTLDLDSATVMDLKNAVSKASGLPVAGLKLLAGGKHLKDDASTLSQCGITPGKTIMVLRQDYSEKVDAEASLTRRTEEAVQAASRLSARAARDIGSGGRGNAWGRWGRGDGDGGGGGRSGGRGGRGGRGFSGERPEIELTNQDGEAMAIPPEDSAALMEGMMLHRQGLACMAKTRSPHTTETATTTGGAAAASASAGIGAPAVSSPDGGRIKKARRRPLTPRQQQQQQQQSQSLAGAAGLSAPAEAPASSTATNASEEEGNRVTSENSQEAEQQSGGWEERKQCQSGAMTQQGADKKEGEGEGEGKGKGKGPLREAGDEMDRMDVDSDADATAAAATAAAAAATASTTAGKEGEEVAVPPGGAGRKHDRPALSAAEKRIAQREALGLLMRAEEAFRRCDPKYLEAVDNYAYLCLDIVWLLFLMKDMKNLELASRMLAAVEKGFQKAHGPGLQRLTVLKGEHCAEKLLYVRLHLLQGVVAFLQGDSGKASGLLIRASAEAKSLKPNPALAARLMQQWHAVKFEVLQPTVAQRALRVGRNNLDAAWQYLENLRQRKDTVRKERRRRREQHRANRHGLTADKKAFVDGSLVDQLAEGGFPRFKAVRALRRHNNDVGAALASLTAAPGGAPGSGVGEGENRDEAYAVLQSLGVPPETAREVLSRTGTLCDALRELGLGEEAAGGSGPGGGGVAGAARGDDGSSEEGGGGDGEGYGDNDDDDENDDDDADSEPTPEEKRLFEELAADRENQDEEGYLDVTLEDEADAADMYLLLCRGNVPVAFDLDKVRASVAAAAAAATTVTETAN